MIYSDVNLKKKITFHSFVFSFLFPFGTLIIYPFEFTFETLEHMHEYDQPSV